MQTVRCPRCRVRFDTRRTWAKCPDCRHQFEVLSPEEHRRRQEEKAERRKNRREYEGWKPLVPVLIVGGSLAVVALVGLVGALLHAVIVSAEKDRAGKPDFAADPVVFDAPAFAQPDPAAQPVSDPLQQPFPNTEPTVPPDSGMPPAEPTPPAPPAAGPAATVFVTLSNPRWERGVGAFSEIQVEYECAAGGRLGVRDVLMAKVGNDLTEVTLAGPPRARSTIAFSLTGAGIGRPRGPIELWMERKTIGGRRSEGQRISNSVTLN